MKQQSYRNHVRFYIPHHFLFYPLILGLLVFCVRGVLGYAPQSGEWIAITATVVLLIWLSLMLRQHYALNNQNRIVRLELRFRYYVLTGKRLDVLEKQLSFGQLAALRFASDAELPGLVDRALKEDLKPDEIKRSIRQWEPDHMRV